MITAAPPCVTTSKVLLVADHSIGAGYFAPTPDQKSFGLIASTGLTLPIVPIAPQLTVALPFSGGRYAVTGEARVRYYGTTMGLGAGVARLATHGSSGTIYDAFISRPIAPLTSIEARFYGFGSDRAGTTGYIGLRFGI
jgi:hypothetical protein